MGASGVREAPGLDCAVVDGRRDKRLAQPVCELRAVDSRSAEYSEAGVALLNALCSVREEPTCVLLPFAICALLITVAEPSQPDNVIRRMQ